MLYKYYFVVSDFDGTGCQCLHTYARDLADARQVAELYALEFGLVVQKVDLCLDSDGNIVSVLYPCGGGSEGATLSCL